MFEHDISEMKRLHLFRELTTADAVTGPFITISGRQLLLMCSNDYLGLASHPALTNAAIKALERHGFGSGASRLVSGTSGLHIELERRIAAFKGTESALVFNSGYAANTGVIPAIAAEGDVILSDSLNHASIIDGCRLSRASVLVYRHRDLDHVEELLKKSGNAKRRLIVTDSVFSMDGDIAPLSGLAALAQQYNALLMVDDAHATGVLGRSGRGSTAHFGLGQEVHIQMGTLGKAFGSFGAYIAGSRELIDYLVNRARSFLFSTALPPSVCAASIAAISIIERQPELLQSLWINRNRFVKGLQALFLNIAATETPIVPILVGSSQKALRASQTLFDHGIYASAIRPPTVPEGSARIRTTVTAAHSHQDIDHALDVFGKMTREGCF
jgi:8-amino-7-oxononanoate synthase